MRVALGFDTLNRLQAGRATFIRPTETTRADPRFQEATRTAAATSEERRKLRYVAVFHTSSQPLRTLLHDPGDTGIRGQGFFTTTDPSNSSGRTGTAHAFVADLSGLEEGRDFSFSKEAGGAWYYVFRSRRALERLVRVPEADRPVA